MSIKSYEFFNTKIFEDFNSKNSLEDIYHNIKAYLENSLNNLIISLEDENYLEIKQYEKEKNKISNKNKKNKKDLNSQFSDLKKDESKNTEKDIKIEDFELNNLPENSEFKKDYNFNKTKSNLFELTSNGGGDTKLKIIQFLKVMFKCYDKDTDLIIKKLEILKSFEIKNYEVAIEFFIEKFFTMIHKNSDSYMNYKFFFEDLLITVFNLSTFNKYPDILFKIIGKNILFNGGLISDNCWNYLLDNICYKLKSLANIKNNISQENISNIISFIIPFSNLLRDLFVNYFDKLSQFSNKNKGLVNEYNYISLIFCRFLKNDIIKFDTKENTEKITSYVQIYEILKILSKIKYLILEKTNMEIKNFLNRENVLDLLHTFDLIYKQNKLCEVETHEILELMQFEFQQIIARFLNYFPSEDLEIIFSFMINFIDSKNSTGIFIL